MVETAALIAVIAATTPLDARDVVDGVLDGRQVLVRVVGELVERLLGLLAGFGVGRSEPSHVVDEVARRVLECRRRRS